MENPNNLEKNQTNSPDQLKREQESDAARNFKPQDALTNQIGNNSAFDIENNESDIKDRVEEDDDDIDNKYSKNTFGEP